MLRAYPPNPHVLTMSAHAKHRGGKRGLFISENGAGGALTYWLSKSKKKLACRETSSHKL